MFSTLLIANRGEIACRIIRTARRMGIRCVAVYSDADRDARHVRLANEAVYIGPSQPSESYLNGERILAAARASGAQAVHPGYGFLSENPEFVQACEESGMTFIGPPADVVRAMGLKDAAKRLMEEAGVPVVPGYHGAEQDSDYLQARAGEIGYPVLIKAISGGGGRGMRRVDNDQGFAEALAGARREAAGAFGDDRVLIEKYIRVPRHIEVQVFADAHGHCVHLFERDCSMQRRHQKVVEEAPAPDMPAAMRAAMGEAAVAACHGIGYQGAGTVEFIADVSHGLDPERFYFMEMNTRLQVEHPVTELITGQDLVEWQLRVAAGQPLPCDQSQIRMHGHAVEARIYAEDPAADFRPASGRLLHLSFPKETLSLRIDTGVRQGDMIGMHYDPMIAKLIAHAGNRDDAVATLSAALQTLEIAGPATNAGFLIRLLANDDFRTGRLHTGLIEHNAAALTATGETPDTVIAAAAVHAAGLLQENNAHDPWVTLKGWRCWHSARQFVHLRAGAETLEIPVTFTGTNTCLLSLPSGLREVRIAGAQGGRIVLEIDGRISSPVVVPGADCVHVLHAGRDWRVELPDRLIQSGGDETDDGLITAPMPGRISRVRASAGDALRKGDTVLVLEAMKMEMSLTAPCDGVAGEISVREGDQVREGETLAMVLASPELDT